MATPKEIFDDLQKAIASLDRAKQLDLAHWIIHLEEEGFDLVETAEDLTSIRRGLEQIERGETISTEEALGRLKMVRGK